MKIIPRKITTREMWNNIAHKLGEIGITVRTNHKGVPIAYEDTKPKGK